MTQGIRLYSQESLWRVTLPAVARLCTPAFVPAFAVLVTFARSEDFYRYGLDRPDVVVSAMFAVGVK